MDASATKMIEPRALRVNDFCRAYGVGRTTAYELINSGRVQSILVGKRRLILRDSAEAWIYSLEASLAGRAALEQTIAVMGAPPTDLPD